MNNRKILSRDLKDRVWELHHHLSPDMHRIAPQFPQHILFDTALTLKRQQERIEQLREALEKLKNSDDWWVQKVVEEALEKDNGREISRSI